MRAVLACALAAAALLAAGGCGGGTSSTAAAKAYTQSAARELGDADPAVAAGAKAYRRCSALESTAPLARRAAIDKEAQGILVFVSLHSLPARYHRFRTRLDAVKTDDPGLKRVRAAVRTVDAKLRRKRFPALDVCAFLRDWKAQKWDTSGNFETSWFAEHGYTPQNALGPRFGAPVHAVATKALVAAGAPQPVAERFTQLAEVYVAGG
jgi:hypothetical protein